MKAIFTSFCLISINAFAGTEIKSDFQYAQVTESKFDNRIPDKQARIEFTFKEHSNVCLKDKVQFMHQNKKIITPKLNPSGLSSHKIKAGKYKFKFWTSFCDTLVTEEIEIKNRNLVSILVHLHSNEMIIESDKPVIYLYPTKLTSVNLKLNYTGQVSFSYPSLTNNEWNVNASPDGNLEIDSKNYSYLFWDGKMSDIQFQTNLKEASVVETKNLVSFFEASLTTMGLNTKEIADFITYWTPRIMQNEKNYIHFMLTDEYDKIASLNITPKPDNQLRIYMIWSEVGNETILDLKPQVFPTFNRTGFSLIEWGGSETKNLLKNL